jgi:polyhydroxybutyrate depolymerase
VSVAPSTVAPGGDAKAPAATTCDLPPGQSSLVVEVDGVQRELLVEVGSKLAQPPAVVFAWHGFGSAPELSRAAMKGAELWDDAIVVAGRGLPRTFEQFGDAARPGWQIAQGEFEDRDLRFFDAAVARLRDRGCLDAHRVYTTGFSNGGFFSNVLACHRADVLAAAAPAGGGGPFVMPCGGSIPVLVTHGRVDEVVPYDSGRKTFEFWRDHDGCDAGAAPPDDGCAAAAGCPDTAAVRMCSFDLGHRWPEGQAERTAEFLRGFTR